MTFLRIGLLLFGVFCCSTAVIMIKASSVPPMLLAAYRLLIAGTVLSPLYLLARRRAVRNGSKLSVRRSLLPGLFLGLHFVTWIIGARLTLAANASLIVNLVPVSMPFVMYFLAREFVNRGEVLATLLAVSGAVLLFYSDYRIGTATLLGDAVCLSSMIFFATYLGLGRKNRDIESVWLYVVPLYFVAGALCLLPGLVFETVLKTYPARELLLILGLGLIPTVLGHSILLQSMRHLRAQQVAICNLGQVVFAGFLAFFLFREVPPVLFYPACLMLAGGAAIAIRHAPADAGT